MGDLQEAEVLWPEDFHATCFHAPPSSRQLHRGNESRRGKSREARPIDIPQAAGGCSRSSTRRRDMDFGCGGGAFGRDGDDADDDKAQIVPPHVIVARRLGGEMASSVCTGHGRKLKGRDLSQVRNSVLRLTGFLEG